MSKARSESRSTPRKAILATVLGLTLGLAGGARAQWFGGGAYYGLPAYGGIPWGYPGYGISYPGWGTGYGFGAGYGFGGYGGYGGWGWGMGMTLADQWMLRYQRYALNASRYNLMNAQTATSYQAALLLRQRALETMLRNYSANKYFAPDGSQPIVINSSGNAAPATTGDPGQRRPAEGDIPFNKLVARDGEVLWPLGAPTDGDLAAKKDAADRVVGEALRDYAEDRNVSVRHVVSARRALADYAYPAAQEMKTRGAKDYNDWVNWISSLDRGLRDLAGAQGRTAAAPAEGRSIEIRPANAPRSAGEVLKQRVQGASDSGKAPKPKPLDGGTNREP